MFHLLNLSFPCLDSLLDFQLNSNLEFSLDSFKLVFVQSLHLLASGLLGMVFKHFQNLFDLEDQQVASHKFYKLTPMSQKVIS
jgi:hypothetical protein